MAETGAPRPDAYSVMKAEVFRNENHRFESLGIQVQNASRRLDAEWSTRPFRPLSEQCDA